MVSLFISLGLIFSPLVYANKLKTRVYNTNQQAHVELKPVNNEVGHEAFASVKGIYSLMKVGQPVNPSVLKLPFLKGVSIRARWSEIEPEEGKFDWSYLDNAIDEAKKASKKAMLRILAGPSSPQWIYKKGVAFIEFKDANPGHNTYGRILTTPIPWDENYIREWIKLVNILGKRYGSSNTLVLVHMAGPTIFSAEMHLLKGQEGGKLTRDAGYSKHNIINAWEEVINAYATAFPEKALALNIAIPFKKDGVLEEVVQYGISKIGTRFCLQGNWLTAYTAGLFYPYRLILGLKDNRVNIGFQMARASKTSEHRQGTLEASVQKGLDAGARYFELYQIDILDESNRRFLEELNKQLTGTSGEPRAMLESKSAETNQELWVKLMEQIKAFRASAKAGDIDEFKSEIVGIVETLSEMQAENPELSGEITKAQSSLDETIRFIESGNRREAKKSFKNALKIIQSLGKIMRSR